jgi:nitroreductase
MDEKAFEELVKSRRSIRRWKKERVPDELIKRAVELATWAPSSGNSQAWRFIVVKNPNVIGNMADAFQTVSDKVASWPEAALWKEEVEQVRKESSFFRNAPVCIGVLRSPFQPVLDKVLTARESFDQDARQILFFRRSALSAVQSVAAAVATMLLAFHEMGLGAVWLVGPLAAKKDLERILKAPPGFDLVCLVAVGYPDESPRKNRKPVDQVLEFIE